MIPDNQTLSSLNYKNPNGTVSVEVSSISADKAILTVKDFSFDNYEDLSIIIKETEFSEPAPLDFSISDTSLILNLSSLRSHFEFRRSKEFRIYILGVHDQKAELFLLKDKSQKTAPWNNFHLFTEEIYFDEDSAIRQQSTLAYSVLIPKIISVFISAAATNIWPRLITVLCAA